MTELERRAAYRAKRDKAQLDAACAMLAALKKARGEIWAESITAQVEAAITQAEAAGIR